MKYNTYEENEVDDFYQLNQKSMSTKKWYQSKTIWFNLIIGVVAVLALPEFVAVFPASWLKYSTFVGAAGNLFLRLFFSPKPIV